jgi:hypothetical protein
VVQRGELRLIDINADRLGRQLAQPFDQPGRVA